MVPGDISSAAFFLVAGLIRLLGGRAAARLRDWIDLAGWVVLGLALLAYVVWRLVGAGA